MLRKAIADIEAKYARKDLPQMRAGDTVRVHTKIKEGDKERIQIFEGVVMAYRKGTPGSSMFTVRKVSYGVGVERMFPVHSPRIDQVEVLGHGEVRRAAPYYLRDLQGKAARLHQEEGPGAAHGAAPAEAPAARAPPPRRPPRSSPEGGAALAPPRLRPRAALPAGGRGR